MIKKLFQKVSWVVLGIAVSLFVGGEGLSARVVHEGTLNGTETWTLSDSPHIIPSDFVVSEEGSLTIEPGVRIEIGDARFYSFYVKGKLEAQGTEDQPIVVTSTTESPTNWTLSLTSPLHNYQISHVQFSNSTAGLSIENGGVEIKNSSFTNVASPIIVYGSKVNLDTVNFSHTTYSSLRVLAGSTVRAQNITSSAPEYGPTFSVEDQSELKLHNADALSSESEVLLAASNSSVEVSDSNFIGIDNGGDGVYGFRSNIGLASTTFSNFFTGLYIRETNLMGTGLSVSSSTKVIYVEEAPRFPGDPMIQGDVEFNVSEVDQNNIQINNSIFQNIAENFVENFSSTTIDARHNWWGNVSGPGNRVVGQVTIEPWLTTNPFGEVEKPELPNPTCCSNVLLIPGFQASRLYHDIDTVRGTSTYQIWEPSSNGDVRALFLTSSTSDSVYASRILDSVLGYSIYGKFLNKLDELVSQDKITEWKAFPYDWRYDIPTIISEGVKNGKGIVRLEEVVNELASSSPTQKVTIVAHSNGGLLAKYAIRELEEVAEKVDKLILVGVPELGTPKAVAALLHGYDQDILHGFIVKRSVAREFGKNMPGVYGLLPSEEYFSLLGAPLINIASTVPSTSFLNQNPTSIISYESFKNFMSGADGRTEPYLLDTTFPSIASPELLARAKHLHDKIDEMDFPDSISVMRIVGTGLPTLSHISYAGLPECSSVIKIIGKICEFTHSLVVSSGLTPSGDGTVVTESARGILNRQISTYFANLKKMNKERSEKTSHATLLNASDLQDLIQKAIVATSSLDRLNSESSITRHEPYIEQDVLLIAIHSPADIHIYDEEGRHTGIVESTSETSDFIRYEDNIPESVYVHPGEEGQFIQVPFGENYKVEVVGNGVGTFTLTIDRNKNGEIIEQTNFKDIPVTSSTRAMVTLDSTSAQQTLVSPLIIDIDNDGSIDAQVATTTTITDFLERLNLIQAFLTKSEVPEPFREQLLKRINRLAKFYEKNKTKHIAKLSTKILRHITLSKGKYHQLTEADKKLISEMLLKAVENLELVSQ